MRVTLTELRNANSHILVRYKYSRGRAADLEGAERAVGFRPWKEERAGAARV